MRTLSGTLTAAQQSDSATPYVQVDVLLDPGGYRYTTKDRLYNIEHTEEPYGGQANIQLKNHDQSLSGKDFKGWRVEIGYGYHTASGDEYSLAAPLWVIGHHDISLSGVLITELVCVDIWQKMSWAVMGADPDTGRPEYAAGWEADTTIRQIIDQLLTSLDPPLSPVTVEVNDGIIDTYKPFYVTQINTPVRKVLRDILLLTKSGMRMTYQGMKIRYMVPGAPPGYTYDTAHAFLSEARQKGLVLPNWIICVDHLPTEEGDAEQYIGTAKNLESIARIGAYPIVKAPPDSAGIASNAEAQTMAESILNQIEAEVAQGRMVVPHNCGQELYDVIQVQDSRAGVTFAGRVGGLIHRYDCGESATSNEDIGFHTYSLEIRLGGLVEQLTTTDPDRLISDLWDLSKIHDWPFGQPGALTPGTSAMPPAYQNWHTDVVFYPGDYSGQNKHNAVHWSAGTVFWPDGRKLAINAGQVTNISAMIYIYWDLKSPAPSVLKTTYNLDDVIGPYKGLMASVIPVPVGGIALIYAPGGSELGGIPTAVVVTPAIAEAAVTSAKIADGAVVNTKVAQACIDSGKLANLSVTTDKMANAIVTHDKMAAMAIDHENIRASAIYGNVVAAGAIATGHLAAGAISADKIAANAVVADKIAANQVLTHHIAANAVTAGKIVAAAIQSWHISVLSLSAINANLGTVTAGRIVGQTAYGWGIIMQGGMFLYNRYGNQQWGWFGDFGGGICEFASAPGIPLAISSAGGYLRIYASGKHVIVGWPDHWGPLSDGESHWYFRTKNTWGTGPRDHAFAPTDDHHGKIGNAYARWMHGYFDTIYVTFPPWQGHDDVELVKKVKSLRVKNGDGVETHIIDHKSLPPEVLSPTKEVADDGEHEVGDDDVSVDLGSMASLTLGAVQQLITRIEAIERRLGI